MKKILLLGFGKSNKAVYEYLKDDENNLIEVISDEDKIKIKKFYQNLSLYDLIFRSPGISLFNKLYLTSKELAKEVTNEIDYALHILNKENVIAVTGSDGKTSLVSLIEHTLNYYKKAKAFGNIGTTLIDELAKAQENDFIIVELSSFQIENLSYEFPLGIIKNLHPNHLDTYKSKEIYFASKLKLINHVKNLIIGNEFNYNLNKEKILPYNIYKKGHYIYENNVKLLDINKLNFQDTTFIDNVIITLKILKFYNFKYYQIENIFNTFKGIKYRLENLGTYNNITFINDGKSSTSSASRYAYNNYKGKKILILGGIHKSQKFNFKIQDQDEIYIYGLHRNKIKKELKKGRTFKTLKEILLNISLQGKMTIIYSPGCSSFDQYTNYIERSQEFEKWVKQWIK